MGTFNGRYVYNIIVFRHAVLRTQVGLACSFFYGRQATYCTIVALNVTLGTGLGGGVTRKGGEHTMPPGRGGPFDNMASRGGGGGGRGRVVKGVG